MYLGGPGKDLLGLIIVRKYLDKPEVNASGIFVLEYLTVKQIFSQDSQDVIARTLINATQHYTQPESYLLFYLHPFNSTGKVDMRHLQQYREAGFKPVTETQEYINGELATWYKWYKKS